MKKKQSELRGALPSIDFLPSTVQLAPLFRHGVPTLRPSLKGPIMKNVEMTVEGTTLTIKVDLSKEFGPSASGKTIIIASTEGNVAIPNREEKVGLNVYRKK